MERLIDAKKLVKNTVHELYKQSIYEKECKEEIKDQICVFIFLPFIS